ncbi:hypothetical protein [Pantoea eucrina]|uniref:hypothetical protein n=1 Tax=Pantoea eucrina TaxID=472693 RepID=UPI00301C20FE
MSENNQLTPALPRTCVDPVDIDLFQAAVFYRDPTLLAKFGLKPDDVQLKDQLTVMGKITSDRNAQRRHEQSKVNKQLKGLTDQTTKADVDVTTPNVTNANPSAPATPSFQRHAGSASQFAPKVVA